MAENSENKQRGRGRPFQKGTSGNPAGKPTGARNLTTRAVENLLSGEADALTRKCVELALEGDSTALRLCMERLAPPRRDRPIEFPMPAAKTAAEVNQALANILEAVGAGTITPTEGQTVAALLETLRRAIETAELEKRVEDMERRLTEER